jgi:hypothetical protein
MTIEPEVVAAILAALECQAEPEKVPDAAVSAWQRAARMGSALDVPAASVLWKQAGREKL